MSKVSIDGKSAKTKFRVLQYFPEHTLVEAMPVTGRTHQIRVHAQFSGHPIVGDDRYGDDDSNKAMRKRGVKRLFLHASQIRVPAHEAQGGEELIIHAPLEKTLQAIIDKGL